MTANLAGEALWPALRHDYRKLYGRKYRDYFPFNKKCIPESISSFFEKNTTFRIASNYLPYIVAASMVILWPPYVAFRLKVLQVCMGETISWPAE